MAGTAARRPLPALVSLVALLVLTGLVWWRVINRDDPSPGAAHPVCTTTTPVRPVGKPTTTLPAPSGIRVDVLNATERTGIAGKARTALQQDGFHSPAAAGNYNGSGSVTGVGEIRYPIGSRAAATLLGYYLPGATLTPTRAKSGALTVVLGPKYTAVRTAAQAAAALAAARATTAPAPSASPTGRTPSGTRPSGTTPSGTTQPKPSPTPTKSC